jgi:hypothetical protein
LNKRGSHGGKRRGNFKEGIMNRNTCIKHFQQTITGKISRDNMTALILANVVFRGRNRKPQLTRLKSNKAKKWREYVETLPRV